MAAPISGNNRIRVYSPNWSFPLEVPLSVINDFVSGNPQPFNVNENVIPNGPVTWYPALTGVEYFYIGRGGAWLPVTLNKYKNYCNGTLDNTPFPGQISSFWSIGPIVSTDEIMLRQNGANVKSSIAAIALAAKITSIRSVGPSTVARAFVDSVGTENTTTNVAPQGWLQELSDHKVVLKNAAQGGFGGQTTVYCANQIDAQIALAIAEGSQAIRFVVSGNDLTAGVRWNGAGGALEATQSVIAKCRAAGLWVLLEPGTVRNENHTAEFQDRLDAQAFCNAAPAIYDNVISVDTFAISVDPSTIQPNFQAVGAYRSYPGYMIDDTVPGTPAGGVHYTRLLAQAIAQAELAALTAKGLLDNSKNYARPYVAGDTILNINPDFSARNGTNWSVNTGVTMGSGLTGPDGYALLGGNFTGLSCVVTYDTSIDGASTLVLTITGTAGATSPSLTLRPSTPVIPQLADGQRTDFRARYRTIAATGIQAISAYTAALVGASTKRAYGHGRGTQGDGAGADSPDTAPANYGPATLYSNPAPAYTGVPTIGASSAPGITIYFEPNATVNAVIKITGFAWKNMDASFLALLAA